MDDISYSARAGGSPQPFSSGRVEPRQEDDAKELRRFRARLRLEVEQLQKELETRTRPPEELAQERLGKLPRRTEAEMRELLETELSRYPTLGHGWDGYSAKPGSPDALRDARRFLSRRPADVPLPYPGLGMEGVIEFYWDNSDLSVVVTFEGDGKFYFLVCRYSEGKETGWYGTEDCPVDSEWPEVLVEPLREPRVGTDTEGD